jgi:PAS domain S-box-containing protein
MVVKNNLKKTQEFSESIIDTIREPLIILDQDLRVVTASRSFYDFFKVKPEETVGQLIYNLGNKQWDIPKLRELLKNILPQKTIFDNYEVEHNFATIGKRIMLLNARQIQQVLGKEQVILLAIEDITERKQADETLRESEERYRVVFEGSIDGILAVELEAGRFSYANPSICRMFGYSEKEFLLLNIEDIHPADSLNLVKTKFELVRREDKALSYELPCLRKDGTVFYANITAVGTIINGRKCVVGFFADVTGRKRMDETLRARDALYRTLVETSPDVILLVDLSLNIVMVNLQTLSVFGYASAQEVIGRSAVDFIVPEQHARIVEDAQNILDSGVLRNLEYTLIRKDGTQFPCEFNAALLKNAAGQPESFIVLLRDITERKRAQAELRDSENRLHTLVQTIPDLIWLKDKDGTYRSCNTMFERFFGAKEVDIIGKTDYDFVDRELADAFRDHDNKAMAAGKTTSNEEWITFADDGHRVFLDTIKTPMYDAGGTLIGVLGIGRDITDRRSVERIRTALGGTVQALAVTVESRDPYTAGHQRRVADLARAIATEMNLPIDIIDGIRMAAAIHDLGKVSVPAEILSKPTKLKKTEFDLIKEHSQSGYDILKDIDFPWPIARIVLEHHERMNGSGYPNGLAGDNILMESRIIAVADVVEAMGSHRPYRPSLGIEAALEEIEKNRGTFYDKAVVDACLRLFREKGFKLVTA